MSRITRELLAKSAVGIRDWNQAKISNTSRNWSAVAYGRGRFVAVAEGSNVAAWSTDGIVWNEVTIGVTSSNWCAITYGKGRFVAISNSNTTIATSINGGQSWTLLDVGLESNYSDIAYGNGYYVIAAANRLIYSSNSTNWFQVGLPGSGSLYNSIAYGDGYFLATDTEDSTIFKFTTPTTWSSITPNLFISSIRRIVYGNGHFVITSGSNQVFISDTGDVWRSITSSSGNVTLVNSYGRGLFISPIDNSSSVSTITVSPDSITTSNNLGASRNWSDIVYGRGRFVIVSKNSNTVTYSKLAPSNLTLTGSHLVSSNIPGISTYRIAYGNGRFVALDGSYSNDGLSWVTPTGTFPNAVSIAYGGGVFIMVNNNGNYDKIYRSTDGINWTTITTSFSMTPGFSVVRYGGGIFIANGRDENNTVNRYAYSLDLGLTWVKVNFGLFGVFPNSDLGPIGYGGGWFVVARTNSNPIRSTDGINWSFSNISSYYAGNANGIAFGNGIFVVTYAHTNIVNISTDFGLTWTSHVTNLPPGGVVNTGNLCGLTFGNGYFIMCSFTTNNDPTIIYYSYDGVNWSVLGSYKRGFLDDKFVFIIDAIYGEGKFLFASYQNNNTYRIEMVY